MTFPTQSPRTRAFLKSATTMAALSLLLTGCLGGAGSPGNPSNPQQDVQAYDNLLAQLDQNRTQFHDAGAMYTNAVDNQLFWLEFPTFNATLHRYDDGRSQQIDYTFSVGDGCDYNYAASGSVIATAKNDGSGNLFYTAYDANQPDQQIGQITMPAPTDGEKWWVYAVDGQTVYYATSTSGGASATALYAWTPASSSPPTEVVDFGSLGIGSFDAIGVSGDRVVFIDGGGNLWLDSLSTNTATPLKNQKQANAFDIGVDGILYLTETATGTSPYFYDFATQMTTDVGAAIQANPYRLNTTFAMSHLYVNDGTLYGHQVVYVGEDGVFRYDLAKQTIQPILLNARDNSTTYRYPTVLSDGAMFVTGLQSTDGAIGAQGPIYRVNLQ